MTKFLRKSLLKFIFLLPSLCFLQASAQNIGDFISVNPLPQNSDFVIPSTHLFQKIIEEGDGLTQGGSLFGNTDFTGYVPINGNSENGYLIDVKSQNETIDTIKLIKE